MEIEKDELSNRTVWQKYLQFEERKGSDEFFGTVRLEPAYVGVACIREVSGYAIWYRRYTRCDAVEGSVPDGDYLIRIFEPQGRNEAIEFAVMASRPGTELAAAIDRLDGLAKGALSLGKREHLDGSIADIVTLMNA